MVTRERSESCSKVQKARSEGLEQLIKVSNNEALEVPNYLGAKLEDIIASVKRHSYKQDNATGTADTQQDLNGNDWCLSVMNRMKVTLYR